MLLLSTVALTQENQKGIFLQFEEDYMNNDATRFAQWISNEYTLSQTLHVPGVGSDTLSVSKQQVLDSMEATSKPNSTPRSTSEDIEIETISENKFCGISQTSDNRLVGDRKYEEKEIRKVCFVKTNAVYKAIAHSIDVHYRAL